MIGLEALVTDGKGVESGALHQRQAIAGNMAQSYVICRSNPLRTN